MEPTLLEQFNLAVFSFFNAAPDASPLSITLAIIIAKYLVYLFPLSLLFYWLWGNEPHLHQQRTFVCKTVVAIAVALFISWLIGVIAPHDRPFVMKVGSSFLEHEPTPSFPSNHGTFIFVVALGYLCWHHCKRMGYLMLGLSLVIAWSRIYLGVHWPIDMIGAFIVALLSCALIQICWSQVGAPFENLILKLYHFCFSYPIRKGWIKA